MKTTPFALVLLCAVAVSAPAMASCLTIPSPTKTITSLYGWRFHPVFKRWRLHRGADFRAPMSTQLVAAQNGVVQIASSSSGGNELRILGDDGTVTRYLHLTRATVDSGARVSAGQAIAISGNTGHASAAPHLHFEVYPKGGGDANPEPLLCGGVSRKPGADQVNGFPIKACNPDGGKCGGDGTPPTSGGTPTNPPSGGGDQSGGGTAPSPGTTSDQPPPPSPKVEQFDDMSTSEIFATEVMKRFANPDWYKELSERTAVPLLIEYLHMEALGQYIKFHKKMMKDRVETLLATKLARQNRAEMEQRLDRQREATAKAGSSN
ncbi:M23 family metallopeptidase [Chromobacterium haemolyticum]|uniref:M23 family metallopeptidase n=1 Tax=Chromobacterium haemolyticum TaxID=394935 RepID=UPI00244896B7|nr:M23 family metallopeptidase [Chromobacterium haemolyticum]MDH0342163.1 M23 family metallopeptidase [Chromobacterium haemolyticum]